ncbi:MAG: GNAT family N-acetyltransferase [Cyclobacteriaceae bacterium]|nr:GNAT family N-acetyltransferase [Cyclobacteriaceae bacterium HetDA_MAG_MS6]
MDQVEIRIAKTKDINELTILLTSLFAQESDFIPDSRKQRKGLEMIIKNPQHGHILVVVKDEQLVGMVNLLYLISTSEGAKVAMLEDMVVNPTFRGYGVGSILIRNGIDFARDQGCQRITLLTDFDNAKAIKFYEKNGFTKSKMIPLRRSLNEVK